MVAYFPEICIDTKFDDHSLHKELLRSLLKKHYGDYFFQKNEAGSAFEAMEHIEDSFPAVFWSDFGGGYFSCTLISEYRPEIFKFLFEIIARWLIPGLRLNVETIFAVDFSFCQKPGSVFNLTELKFSLKDPSKIEELRKNFSHIERELKLGASSKYQAQRILDIKGLSGDQKTTLMQEQIASLIQQRPQDFDMDLLVEMQRFLMVSSDTFKELRECRLMCRIICVQYLFRKEICRQMKRNPSKRYFSLKCMRSHLHCSTNLKPIFAIVLGMNFLKRNERFEEEHLLRALQRYLPGAKAIEGSFFQHSSRMDKVHTMYIELHREKDFSIDEIKLLRKELPEDLKHYIEHLMHPIFMPCNEEEILRNILILSDELKYVRDIPQVIISFEEQNDASLSFRVTFLRVKKKTALSLAEHFSDSVFCFHLEQQKIVGYLRKRYPKEATVFRLEFKKASFLRDDHSLDLYKARHAVVAEILQRFGDFRDFNGGMISKQNELLTKLKGMLNFQSDFLLENFFYSLQPLVMRSILDAAPLKSLFLMFCDLAGQPALPLGEYLFRSKVEGPFLLLFVSAKDADLEPKVKQCLAQIDLAPLDLASTSLLIKDQVCLGFIYRIESQDQCQLLQSSLQDCMEEWMTDASKGRATAEKELLLC